MSSIQEVGGDTRYEVKVIDSYDSRISLHRSEYIFATGRCPCPLLRAKHEYIIVGKYVLVQA